MKGLKLSAVALAVMASAVANAVDVEHTCENNNGCYYNLGYYALGSYNHKRIWTVFDYREHFINNKFGEPYLQDIGDENSQTLKIKLKPQHYESQPIQEQPEKYKRFILLGVEGDEKNAELTIPTGTTMTLSGIEPGSRLISLRDTKANIEKGVQLMLDPTYSEIHHLNDENIEQKALYVRGSRSNVTSSADITVNSVESTAVDADDNAKVTLKDHAITLNADLSTAIKANKKAN